MTQENPENSESRTEAERETKEAELTAQMTLEERPTHRVSPGHGQRGPSIHGGQPVLEGNHSRLGRSPRKDQRQQHQMHTGLGIAVCTSQSGKPHDPHSLGRVLSTYLRSGE